MLRSWLGATGRRASGCVIVGEVAQAHDGSLGTAHAYIDAIARAGADAVKFQTHIAAAESTPAEPWRVPFSPADATRYDYWKRMEFSEAQWRGLKAHAEALGLVFISSPFSGEAVDLLLRLGVRCWKVASGEMGTTPMLDAMAATGLPMILSTGLTTPSELDRVVARLTARGVRLAILQCTTAYPCPPERVGLNLLPAYQARYGCPVGLSDHSGTIYPGIAAVALGAEMLEVHVTLSREAFGPDVVASVTTGELATLVEGVRFVERARLHPVDKEEDCAKTAPVRAIFQKSVVARVPLQAGTILAAEHLTTKKPGTGLPPERLADLLCSRLRRNLEADEPLRLEDVELPI